MKPSLFWAAAPLAALSLAACSGEAEKAPPGMTEAPASKTLVAAIGDADDLSALETLIGVSGLDTVYEGVGPYTILAPTNAALQAAPDLGQSANRAAAAALLRAHTLPGAVTRADIGKAIDARGGPVTMRTMGGGEVTFARDGETLTVTGPDNARARLTGSEQPVSNGVIQPVDALAAPTG